MTTPPQTPPRRGRSLLTGSPRGSRHASLDPGSALYSAAEDDDEEFGIGEVLLGAFGTPESSMRERVDAQSRRTKRVLDQVKQRARFGRTSSAPGRLAELGDSTRDAAVQPTLPLLPPGSPSVRPRRQEGGFGRGRMSSDPVSPRAPSPLIEPRVVPMLGPPPALPVLQSLEVEHMALKRNHSRTRENWESDVEGAMQGGDGSAFNRVHIDREMFVISPEISEVSRKLLAAVRLREQYQNMLGYSAGSGEASLPTEALAPVATEKESADGERLRQEAGVFDLPRWRREPAFSPLALPQFSVSEAARALRVQQIDGIFYAYEATAAKGGASTAGDGAAAAGDGTASAGATAATSDTAAVAGKVSTASGADGDAAGGAERAGSSADSSPADGSPAESAAASAAAPHAAARANEVLLFAPVHVTAYYTHFHNLMRLLHDGETRSMTYRRLKVRGMTTTAFQLRAHELTLQSNRSAPLQRTRADLNSTAPPHPSPL